MKKIFDLLIATTNKGKLGEFRQFFDSLPIRLRSLQEFDDVAEVAETGLNFGENADLKAAGYARATNLLTLADDSGLEVAALNRAPGVFSARWGGAELSDAERCEKLLRELSKTHDPQRLARFVCVISIADPTGAIKHRATGVCDGTIAANAVGTNGFGYDSIFVPAGFARTFGELSVNIKRRVSHRARATNKITAYLSDLLQV